MHVLELDRYLSASCVLSLRAGSLFLFPPTGGVGWAVVTLGGSHEGLLFLQAALSPP